VKRWLREPLLHFLVTGGLLFAAYDWLDRGGDDAPRLVHITAAEVDWLKEVWTRQWHRQPDQQELGGLVTDYLKEQLLAREAREIGLEEGDTVVRRRLAQKMDFLVQDTARLVEPGEDELRQLYHGNPLQYQTPARVSFHQIPFKTEAAARTGLAELSVRAPADLGDPTLLERDLTAADEQTVTSLFGPKFSAEVFALEPGPWHGPIPSSYGFHLVQISDRQPAQRYPFDDVRAQVLDEWYRRHREKANEQFFAALLKKYDVVVDKSVRPLIGLLAEVAP
jgi:parvulin-like peptidyl-prolyl isomerase